MPPGPVPERLRLFQASPAAQMNDAPRVEDPLATLSTLGYDYEAELLGALGDVGDGRAELAQERLEALLDRPDLDLVTGAGAAALRLALLLIKGDQESAERGLSDLLGRVAPQRLLLVFTIAFLAGEACAQLLVDEAARPDGHPCAAQVLEALETYVASAGADSPRSRAVAQALRAASGRRGSGDAARTLTPRERDVLSELALGGSYGDVAQALFVSENTVKTHLTSVYRKLEVDRRGEALRIARELGLI